MNLFSTLACFCFVSASASAAIVVYENDFSTPSGGGFGFNEFTTAQWSPGTGVFNNQITGDSVSAANISLPAVPGNNFVITTVFTIPTVPSSGAFTIGFSALGNSTTSDFYLADVNNTGGLRLGAFNSGTFVAFTGTTAGGTPIGNLISTETYTMTLTGTYVGTSLTLLLSVSDGTNEVTLSGTAPGTAKTGTHFGYRNRVNTDSVNGTFAFDSFSATIPEPSSALALGISAMGLLLRRRKP